MLLPGATVYDMILLTPLTTHCLTVGKVLFSVQLLGFWSLGHHGHLKVWVGVGVKFWAGVFPLAHQQQTVEHAFKKKNPESLLFCFFALSL